MTLKTCARTPGGMVGNHMLERADALVIELLVPAHIRDDARQVAVLAMLEERDPEEAIRKECQVEKRRGVVNIPAGKNPPTVLSMSSDPAVEAEAADDGHEAVLVRREEAERRANIAGAVLMTLTPRERRVVQLRAMGWTQDEIATAIGVGQQHASRILAHIAAKSRRYG